MRSRKLSKTVINEVYPTMSILHRRRAIEPAELIDFNECGNNIFGQLRHKVKSIVNELYIIYYVLYVFFRAPRGRSLSAWGSSEDPGPKSIVLGKIFKKNNKIFKRK